MKIILILGFIFLLQACKSTNTTKENEQDFICKSLIQGYLQSQQLGQYKFHQKKYENEREIYTFNQPTVSGMVLGIPQTLKLQFECLNPTENVYKLKIIYPYTDNQSVLQVQLMPKKDYNFDSDMIEGD